MENATKALLIAAAVLVAILIISLGLVIYNMASETIDGAGNLSEYEVQQHNEKFLKYIGDNKAGSNVNAMLKTVFNHNVVAREDGTAVQITGSAALGTDSTQPATNVPTGSRYDVTATYGDDGRIITINIAPAS